MKIELREKLGLQWQLQPVLIDTGITEGDCSGNLSVYLDNECVPSDLFHKNGRVYASFAMSLEPFSQKTISTGPSGCFDEYIEYKNVEGALTVRWLDRSIRLPVPGVYSKGCVPSFMESLVLGGRELILNGRFISNDSGEVTVSTELLIKGYQYCSARISYSMGESLLETVDISINGRFPQISIKEQIFQNENVTQSIRFLPSFSKARARLHTPKIDNHVRDFWERVEISPKEQEEIILKLQPFYAWDVNAGTYLAAQSEGYVINIVPVNASLWRNGRNMRLMASFSKGRMVLDAPGAKGAREWLLSVIHESDDEKQLEPVMFIGNYNNYYYQTGKRLLTNYHAERLSACCSSQSINKLFSDINPDYNIGQSEGILVERAEMPALMEKLIKNEFIKSVIEVQEQS
ncbi:MAG: hypothetical protein JW903_03365, partial [Clostridia bacterium]|nr:hypothetical protein [Clostridia bacterium]